MRRGLLLVTLLVGVLGVAPAGAFIPREDLAAPAIDRSSIRGHLLGLDPFSRAALRPRFFLRQPGLFARNVDLDWALAAGPGALSRLASRREGVYRAGLLLQRDPLGYEDGPNLYSFAGADPVNYRDPMGTQRFKVAVGGVDVHSPREAGIMARQGRAALEAYRQQQATEAAAREAAVAAYWAEYERIYGRPPSPEEAEAIETAVATTGFEHLAASDETFAPGIGGGLIAAGGRLGETYLATGGCKTAECLEAAREAGASWLEPEAARQRGRYLGQIAAGATIRTGEAALGAAVQYRVGKHGAMPSPRAGSQSHHGVMSAWMKAHFPGYDPLKAPAILMPERAHQATFGVYNRWRQVMRQRMGGVFDWRNVGESEMRALSDEMLNAADVPIAVREEYWQQFERMKAAVMR